MSLLEQNQTTDTFFQKKDSKLGLERSNTPSKFDLLNLYLSISDLSGEEQLNLIKSSVENVIRDLETRVNSGKAELFLETVIDSTEVFKYLQEGITQSQLNSFEETKQGLIQELKDDFDPIIIDTLTKIRAKFLDLLETKILEHDLIRKKIILGDQKQFLGKGGIGQVSTFEPNELTARRILGFYIPQEDIPLAIKYLNHKTKIGQNREVNDILLNLDHPNLMKFFGYSDLKNERVVIQEYIPGALSFSELNQHKNLKITQILEIIAQALYGCLELNQQGLAHNDIKMPNIIVVLDQNEAIKLVKLIDYDTVKKIDQEEQSISGTLGMVAPERLFHHKPTSKSDVYSFGAMLCKILFKSIPCLNGNKYLSADEYFDSSIPPKLKELMGKLIEIEPENRASLTEAIQIVKEIKQLAESELKEYFENKSEILTNKQIPEPNVASIHQTRAQEIDKKVNPEQKIAQKNSSYEYHQAIALANQFLAEETSSPGGWLYLGNAYEQIGDLLEARKAYAKASKFGKNGPIFVSHLNRVNHKINFAQGNTN